MKALFALIFNTNSKITLIILFFKIDEIKKLQSSKNISKRKKDLGTSHFKQEQI